MRVLIITTVLILATLILWGTANAACQCVCVNGMRQAMCSSGYESPPACYGQCGQIQSPVQAPPFGLMPLQPAQSAPTCYNQMQYDPNTMSVIFVPVCE